MTKRDYELIAAALRKANTYTAEHVRPGTATGGVGYASVFLADALADTNPRFDRKRFLDACAIADA